MWLLVACASPLPFVFLLCAGGHNRPRLWLSDSEDEIRPAPTRSFLDRLARGGRTALSFGSPNRTSTPVGRSTSGSGYPILEAVPLSSVDMRQDEKRRGLER